MNDGLLVLAISVIAGAALLILIRARIRLYKKTKTVKQILGMPGKKSDPISDVNYAIIHLHYGNKKRAMLLLNNALRTDTRREDIKKAIEFLETNQ
jgi:hypothetical protein